MRLHPGVGGRSDSAPCPVLVGGYGLPGCRDLDFGERFVRLAEGLDWPEGVVVEDLSCSAHLVLHRLRELRPAKLVLVGATARGLEPPGTVRRYRVGGPAPSPGDVHTSLTEAVGGRVGLDNLLTVARHFGGLPADTVVLEVEAADASFGLGFSEEVAAAIDPLLDVVRDEVGGPGGSPRVEPALASALGRAPAGYPTSTSPGRAPGRAAPDAALPGIDQLFQYAHAHAQVRALEALGERLPAGSGVAMAARFLPAGTNLGMSGDWYEVVALDDGAVGVVVARVAAARRVDAATVIAQLDMAVRALALLEGSRPASVVDHLDRLATSTGVGVASTLAYLALDRAAGTLRLANAGHRPPLVIAPDGRASFVGATGTPALGAAGGAIRELAVPVEPGSTLLVFTDGLLRTPGRSAAEGLRLLRRAAESGPTPLEELCDHILQWCLPVDRPAVEDDVSLLALRLVA